MGKCDLDECSLKEGVENRNEKIDEMHTALIKMTTSYDMHITSNQREHDALFERTKGVLKVAHVPWIFGAVGTIIGAVYTIVQLANK